MSYGFKVGGDYSMLDNPATFCIDGVGYGRMEHRATVYATRCTFRVELASALRTETRTEMVLHIATITMVRQFTRRHVYEPSSSTEDNFDIADNECIFKRDIREGFETLIALLRLSYEPYADFCDLQRRVTLDLGCATVKEKNPMGKSSALGRTEDLEDAFSRHHSACDESGRE